jgi:hypothetical protein
MHKQSAVPRLIITTGCYRSLQQRVSFHDLTIYDRRRMMASDDTRFVFCFVSAVLCDTILLILMIAPIIAEEYVPVVCSKREFDDTVSFPLTSVVQTRSADRVLDEI